MANPRLRFRFHEPKVDTNLPLTDGTVAVEGFDLECVEGEADAWDQSFGALVALTTKDAPYISIPAYPNRKFRQSYIQVNDDAGIEVPGDLEGKSVGIYAWSNTAGVWARGALQNYYKVDLTKIRWLSAKRETLPHLPAGIEVGPLPEAPAGIDQLLDDMLLAGDLDAVISPNVLPSISRRDRRVRRLFRDYKSEEQSYFKNTGIFPISHVVTLSRDFVGRYPESPVALLKAYRRARDVAFDRIEGSDPVILTISWASAMMAEQRDLMGDHYWAYNIESNRRSLEAMMKFSFQQGLTATQLDYESLFDRAAVALPGG